MASVPPCLRPFRKQPPKTFVDQESQTVIKRKCQIEMSIQLDTQETKKFYSMLEYTPYQDIQESCIKIIPLAQNFLLHAEPNALSRLNLNLRDLVRCGRQARTYADMDAQTDLKVRPMVLDDEEVASVLADSSAQTEELLESS